MSETILQPRSFDRDIRVEHAGLTEEEQFALWEAELPSSKVWLVNPAKQQFETPTDERGIVDLKALVALGKAAVIEDYVWDTRETRNDHLCWPETAYQQLAEKLDDPLPMLFRNVPPNRVLLPLEFERWKHAITIPPDFPSLEVMRYYVDAWSTAKNLYLSVDQAVRWQRRFRRRSAGLANGNGRSIPRSVEDAIGQELLVDTLAANFKGADRHLESHLRLPSEFRFINPGDDARRILQLIGYQVRHHCRDGLRSRHSTFIPAQRLTPAA